MTRFLLYSHDTYGLGHLRRNTLLAEAIVAADPGHEVLIATGSPLAQTFSLPDRIDTLKLPSATKDGLGAYRPRKLGGSIDALVELRSTLLLAAFHSYAPDVTVVDHSPIGMAGELIPLLDQHSRGDTGRRLVLGLRDIIDDATQVDNDWRRSGVWEWIECYDDILVYGDPKVLTTATELDLARRVSASLTHTGYVAPTMPAPSHDGEPYLLVTPGGGGDGQALLRRYLAAVKAGATGTLRSVVVTGPLLSSTRRAEIDELTAGSSRIETMEFSADMRTLIASAAGVVSMGGYNTVVEELAADVPALVVPRCHPRLEQHIRSTRLAPLTHLEHCPIETLDPDVVERFASSLTVHPDQPRGNTSIRLDGAATVARHLSSPSHDLARPRPTPTPLGVAS